MDRLQLPRWGGVVRAGVSVVTALLAAAAVAGCGSSSASPSASEHTSLRLGYFANLTHAPAIVGVDRGIFAKDLGTKVQLKTSTFNAGPDEVQALFSGALDVAFIGPSPTINAYAKSHGEAIRVIAGAASGGAALVVKPSITSAAQLRGKTIASPQLGNTQDVALRYWLKQQGYATDRKGGGDVHVAPQDNSTTVTSFASGAIDGAWVPEPYASRLVGAGGHVLVDERTLWPGGRFVTTNVIVRTAYLKSHRAVVQKFLKGLIDTVDFINANPTQAQQTVNTALGRLTGKTLKPGVLTGAWKTLSFTVDPLAATLRADAAHAQAVGIVNGVKLSGLYDLSPLNAALRADHRATVAS